MTKKIDPSTIDNVFDGVEIPDDRALRYQSAALNRMANPLTKQKLSRSITEKQNQKEYLEHMSQQRNAAMDQVIDNSGMTLREKLTIANQLSAKNPVHHANRCAANQKLKNDLNWQQAHAKGVLNYSEETVTPLGIFPSMSHFIKESGKPGARSFLKSLPHLFYQTKTGPGKPTYERLYYTPFGCCASVEIAYQVSQKNKEPNAIKLKNIEGWWLKMATLYSKQYFVKFEKAKYWPLEQDKPIGILEVETKPRIANDKVKDMKEKWLQRLVHHKTLYKKK